MELDALFTEGDPNGGACELPRRRLFHGQQWLCGELEFRVTLPSKPHILVNFLVENNK
jgi:hypothetical protein